MKSVAVIIPNFTLYRALGRAASHAPKKQCRITLTLCDIFTGFRGLDCLFSRSYLVVFVSHNSGQVGGGGVGGEIFEQRGYAGLRGCSNTHQIF